MKKFTLKLCFFSLCIASLGLSSCRDGKMNNATVLAANMTVKQIAEHSGTKSNLSFKGKCYHVDKKIPWNECDKCGLHKVYW